MRRLALPFVLLTGLLPLALTGCKPGYSPNTYAANAAQEEANVQRGVIIGVRQVLISTNGTVGTATGGAAGGAAGAQVGGSPLGTALGAIGGTLVGGIAGTAAAQAVADTKGWEYIVEETGNKLVSVTQTSKAPLPVGLHVLVIADSQQARIVPDYTVQITPPKTATASNPVPTEIYLDPMALPADAMPPLQIPPMPAVASPARPAPTAPATAPDTGNSATPPAGPVSTGATPASAQAAPDTQTSSTPPANPPTVASH